MISAGYRVSVALKTDGTVVAAGANDDGQITAANTWTGVARIVQHGYGQEIYAILIDGTAIGAGSDVNGQISGIASWTNLTQITCGGPSSVGFVAGLKSDGTVVAAGDNTHGQVTGVSGWTDIIQLAAGFQHILGLKSDGTVVAAGDNNYSQVSPVTTWTGITQVSAGYLHSVGLQSDGTAVACGYDSDGQVTGVSSTSWASMTQVAAGQGHSLGLEPDPPLGAATVKTAGANTYGELDTSWFDIVQVSAGHYYSLGLVSDGTLEATGYDADGQVTGAQSWTGVNTNPDGLALNLPEILPEVTPSIGRRFLLTLTGAADATTDVVLPVTNVNARLRSGSNSYLQVTVPYTSDHAAAVTARTNGDLQLIYTDAVGEYAVVDVALETIQVSRGNQTASIVLTGHRQSTNSTPTSHNVTAQSLQTGTTATTAIIPGYDPAIKPADDVTAEGSTYTLDVIALQAAVGSVRSQLIGA